MLDWPVEAVVHAGLRGSTDFAAALGDGSGTWLAGTNKRADSSQIVDGIPVADVEVKITVKENAADYDCLRGCTMQLEHLAHQGTLVIVTCGRRADRDRAGWVRERARRDVSELAMIMDRCAAPTTSASSARSSDFGGSDDISRGQRPSPG